MTWACTYCGNTVESVAIPTHPCGGCGRGPAWTEGWRYQPPADTRTVLDAAARLHVAFEQALGMRIFPRIEPFPRLANLQCSLRSLGRTIWAVLVDRPLPDRKYR